MNDNPKQLFEAIKWVKGLKLNINDIVDDVIEGSYIIYISLIKELMKKLNISK